jgi:hypothetical protein
MHNERLLQALLRVAIIEYPQNIGAPDEGGARISAG